MERPNTVSGLVAKRAELVAYRTGLEAELRKVTVDIDHLDAAIRIFDPATTPAAIKRYATQHRAKKGALKRFVLNALREADGPLTTQEITVAWCADRGLRTDDATYVILRKRVGSCLIAAVAVGLVRREGMAGVWQRYALA